MVFDIDMIRKVYSELPGKINDAKEKLGRPLTLTEKILFSHLSPGVPVNDYKRAEDYVDFAPDRVAMQDATAQMALLQLMNSGRKNVAVPSTVHCDHLIQAYKNAETDLNTANVSNREVYDFLKDVSNKFGIGFWKPGAGIIHQVVLENYAFPGGMMVGTDSHTPNAGGLGMVAIGVGGADAVDVMAALPWELKMPNTNIGDIDFRQNAETKANALGLDSFLLWNVTHARLYVRDDASNEFVIHKQWDELDDIATREDVLQNRRRWELLAENIFSYLNDIFDRGELEGRQFRTYP